MWWPTWQGAALALSILAAGLLTFALTIDRFLAPVAPARGADGHGARTLVVEGWIDPPMLHRAVDVFRAGHYERVVTTGGSIEAWMDKGDYGSFAARTAALLKAVGGIDVPIVAVPARDVAQERTYESAVAVRDWAAHASLQLDALDIYTADVHARRSRLVYRLAFGRGTEIGILADPRRRRALVAQQRQRQAHSRRGDQLGLDRVLLLAAGARRGALKRLAHRIRRDRRAGHDPKASPRRPRHAPAPIRRPGRGSDVDQTRPARRRRTVASMTPRPPARSAQVCGSGTADTIGSAPVNDCWWTSPR